MATARSRLTPSRSHQVKRRRSSTPSMRRLMSLYGCHVPGHYDAGMVGTITVEGDTAASE